MAKRLKEKGQAGIAKVLGVAGGVTGVIAGLVIVSIGGAGMLLVPEGGAGMVGLGVTAIAFGIGGGIGGMISGDYPELATAIMAIVGVGGFVVATVLWIVPGLLLIGGSVLAWQSRAVGRLSTRRP